MNHKTIAIILAAGSGRRMGADVPKQYMPLGGVPLMVHSLKAFARSRVDEIILVVAPGEVAYCQQEIIDKYYIEKIAAIVEGGAERYDSVYRGIKAIAPEQNCSKVLIHDSARPFISVDLINSYIDMLDAKSAVVAAVPAKDTIKITDEAGIVVNTPNRNNVWQVQTPQCFSYDLIKGAYEALMDAKLPNITDDAMVVEAMTNTPVSLVMADYNNIKITTPEDLIFGENILSKMR